MNSIVDLATNAVIVGFLLGLVVYGLLLLAYTVDAAGLRSFERIKAMLDSAPGYTFGLPISAATAFAIVSVLEQTEKATLEFKAFGAEFSGPAAPVTLWLVCFLSLVAAMRIVRP
jgi:hypothetical protein